MTVNMNQTTEDDLPHKIEANENQSGISTTGHNDDVCAVLQAFANQLKKNGNDGDNIWKTAELLGQAEDAANLVLIKSNLNEFAI